MSQDGNAKSNPQAQLSYAETHPGKTKDGKYTVPKGQRSALIYPMPDILYADGMTREEWEVILNTPLWLMRHMFEAIKTLKDSSVTTGLVYPLERNVPPPPFIGRFGRPSKADMLKFQQSNADFIPPFPINGPRPAWPFKIMEPGDSFVAPKKTNIFRNMSSYTRAEQERGRRVTFTSRAINKDWVRIWCLWDTYDYDNDGLHPPKTDNASALQEAIQATNDRKRAKEKEAYQKKQSALAYDPKSKIIAGISDQMFLDLGASPEYLQDPSMELVQVRTVAYQMMLKRAKP